MGRGEIITIDGPAGAGKSTVAKLLAAALGYFYLDSGALYRLVAWQALERNLDLDDTAALHTFLDGLQPQVTADAQGFHLVLDGREVSQVLREPRVSRQASRVAVLHPVRSWVNARLRQLAANGGAVAEGRDLGTVVFPDAKFKFFLDASLKTRAQRRQQDWQAGGKRPALPEIMQALDERDRRDATRQEGPTRVPPGALVIDTTHLSAREVAARCLDHLQANAVKETATGQ